MKYIFFIDSAATGIYTLSLHDALPIWGLSGDYISLAASMLGFLVAAGDGEEFIAERCRRTALAQWRKDRKSTRLNSSHLGISYAGFCLKKKTGTCPSS